MKLKLSYILGACLMVSLTACAHSPNDPMQRTPENKLSSISNELSIIPSSNDNTDGSVVSLKKFSSVTFPSRISAGTGLYSLTYMSRGLKVQGYLVVPAGRGPFPLYMGLHGGYFLSGNFHTNDSIAVVTKTVATQSAIDGDICFFPNYAGFGPSQGDVGDAYDSYIDTMNGLAALSQIKGLHVQNGATYLVGSSMGGLVAMDVAENDSQVKAIALISPDPGAIQFVSWADQNRTKLDKTDWNSVQSIKNAEGKNLKAQWYQDNSVSYADIRIPVMIIGGNNDPIIPPALLEQMYKDVSRYNSQVTLKFVPGGHVPSSSTVNYYIFSFLSTYGMHWNYP